MPTPRCKNRFFGSFVVGSWGKKRQTDFWRRLRSGKVSNCPASPFQSLFSLHVWWWVYGPPRIAPHKLYLSTSPRKHTPYKMATVNTPLYGRKAQRARPRTPAPLASSLKPSLHKHHSQSTPYQKPSAQAVCINLPRAGYIPQKKITYQHHNQGMYLGYRLNSTQPDYQTTRLPY